MPADRPQVGRAVSGRRRRAGCAIAARGLTVYAGQRRSQRRASRGAAPSALHRQADRGRTRHLAGDRQPHPQAPGPEPDRASNRPSRCAATSAKAGRDDPHRHQEARPLRARGPSHHRRPQPAIATAAASAGSSSMSASTTPRASPSAKIMPDERKRQRHRLPQGRGRLLREPRRHGRARDDRQRLLLSNPSPSRRACKRLGLRHIRTRPYTPKTNGKAERFIQTSPARMGLRQAYRHSRQRAAELPSGCTDTTGIDRTAASNAKLPISRLGLTGNNLLRLHT